MVDAGLRKKRGSSMDTESRGLLLRLVVGISSIFIPVSAQAFFFFFPIPNLAKPAPLQRIIDALEKSEETKAVAYTSESKSFGSKFWVWGQFYGHVTQEEANRNAMTRCVAALANAKNQQAGGNPLYDFGSKTCELHVFQNPTVSPKAVQHPAQTATPVAPANPPPSSTEGTKPTPEQAIQPVNPPSAPSPAPSQLQTNVTPTTPSQSQSEVPSAAVRPAVVDGLPTVPSAPQTTSQTTVPQTSETPTARRLRELNDLLKSNMVTQTEYEAKRKAILSEM